MASGSNLLTSYKTKILTYHPDVTSDTDIDDFLEGRTLKIALWNNFPEGSTKRPGVSNGILISGGWSNNSYGFQLSIDDDPTYYIALRQKGNTNGWNAWRQIVTNAGSWDINSATATKLTSNAGGTEQPIYFTDGKPSATSYALKATINNSTAGYMAYYSGDRAISGTSNIRATSAGTLSVFPSGGSYRDGIRIHARSADNSWAALILCGADNTGDSGTSANTWFFGATGGDLYLGRNGTGGSGTYLRCVNNVWEWNGTANSNAATATRINGSLAAATSNVDRNIWVSSTASADGIPNYISSFNMNPSTKVFNVPSGTRISPSEGALYLGNSSNASWVYLQDCASQSGTDKWKITQAGAALFVSTVTCGGVETKSDINLYTSSADSPDITWWYADKGKEQARIWMGSGDSSKWAPYYRCYNSSGTSLYSGCLVLGDGTGASGTWGINITGSASSSTIWTRTWQRANDCFIPFLTVGHSQTRVYMCDSNTANKPSGSGAGYMIAHSWDWGGGAALLYQDFDSGSYSNLWVNKRHCGDDTAYQSWAKILHSGNYTDYTVTKTGSGASGSWGINAATATRINGTLGNATSSVARNIWVSSTASADGIPQYISSFYYNSSTKEFGVPSGTRIYPQTGALYLGNSGNQSWVYVQDMASQASGTPWKIHQNGNAEFNGTVTATTFSGNATNASGGTNDFTISSTSSNRARLFLRSVADVPDDLYLGANNTNKWSITCRASNESYMLGLYSAEAGTWRMRWYHDGHTYADSYLHNAVWNDIAECRKSDETEPGRVIIPANDGKAYRSTERLQSGGRIISDTYGIVVGETNEAKTPIGLAGRVLAYPYRSKNEYHIGDAVCSAPNGTVDIMTRDEIMMYPERILGIVNEIPLYDIWDQSFTLDNSTTSQKIEVKGRIWIDIK